ncbi:MAG TPA: glycine cleavage system aminomethyltransferase GcvT [Vicinamibacterales bacterium]|nr:glycine cleavage system aminomethyltransferase GcvT [Vicinamibacterales bacterium]
MPQVEASALKQTPLHAEHVALGARLVPFAGWEMPVEYSGISDEHRAVRTRAGLFDVSHMGEIEVAGRDALAALQHVTCNDVAKLSVGQAQYSALTTPEGTFVDDLLVYRLASDHFLLVVNAANVAKDYRWIRDHVKTFGDVVAFDASSRYALIALQGPASREILQPLTGIELGTLKYYWFAHGEIAGVRGTLSRTGYTGEDGYEIFVPPNNAARVWNALLDAGRAVDARPAGLGARDTLRLEAAMRLYGSDIDDSTSVLEADLEWIVAWEKGEFIGRAALAEQKQKGIRRRLRGFLMVDRGIARHGCTVMVSGKAAGTVTSGTQTPFLQKAIGLAYVPAELGPGDEIAIDIRGRAARASLVPLPFYKRPRRT